MNTLAASSARVTASPVINATRSAAPAGDIKHTYTPQTNGEAERFIQTCLREWAYGRLWHISTERTAWLPAFLDFYNIAAPTPRSATGLLPQDSAGTTYRLSTPSEP